MTVHSPARPSDLRAQLNVLHDEYVEAINYAVAADDETRISELAAAYDEEAIRLVADHEGKADLVPAILAARRAS